VLAVPFGNYIDIEQGVRIMTSTWRRNATTRYRPAARSSAAT
jgi:hypothetical protein